MRVDRDYRPGTLNVTVNGMQIEDLFQEYKAYKRRTEELTKDNERMRQQLKEQGRVITELKKQSGERKNNG